MISFCIITDGKEPEKLRAEIESIHALDCEMEIILAGDPNGAAGVNMIIPMPTVARQGRLGALRNAAASCANGGIIVVVDDDMIFDSGWARAVHGYEGDWDVMSCRILNPDGSRYWDWKAHEGGKNWLLDYDSMDERQSLTGGLTIMKPYVWDRVKWNGELGFNQAEDVDFTQRLKQAGFTIVMNIQAVITHDAPYIQKGIGVFKVS